MTNRRFDEYMRDRILRPIGVRGSYNLADILDSIDNIAVLYNSGVAKLDNFKGVAPQLRDLSSYKIGLNGFIFGP